MARQFALLAALTGIGMKVAGVVDRAVDATIAAPAEVEPQQQAEQAETLATAYARVARAVRLNLAMENQITQEHRNRAARERAEREGRCAIGPTTRRNRLKEKAERVLNQVIEQEIPPIDRKNVRGAMRECLEEFDDDPDFTSRSVGEIVASVSADLQIDPDWSWWQDERWAVREIRNKPPGSPYATWQREPDDDDEPAPALPESAGHDPPRSGS
ncbi:MAG: hypothetical protein WCC64_06745 [Aliidongia sp.]